MNKKPNTPEEGKNKRRGQTKKKPHTNKTNQTPQKKPKQAIYNYEHSAHPEALIRCFLTDPRAKWSQQDPVGHGRRPGAGLQGQDLCLGCPWVCWWLRVETNRRGRRMEPALSASPLTPALKLWARCLVPL